MPFLVTDSAVPLPAETLPALKLTHHYDAPARGEVYAYLRCYVHKGALCYNLLVFDEAPPPTARIGFALCPAESEGEFLFASFGRAPGSDALALCLAQPGGGYAAVRAFSAPAAKRSAGEDEQGPYWWPRWLILTRPRRTITSRYIQTTRTMCSEPEAEERSLPPAKPEAVFC